MNRPRIITLLAGLILAGGCAAAVPELTLPADDPANPEAAEAAHVPSPSPLATNQAMPAEDEPDGEPGSAHDHSATQHKGHQHHREGHR